MVGKDTLANCHSLHQTGHKSLTGAVTSKIQKVDSPIKSKRYVCH